MTIQAPRKTRRGTKFARGSAAAFAVGLFLAAPHAVAGADSADDAASAPAADAGPAAGKGGAGRGEGRTSDSANPERAGVAGRSAGAAVPRPAAAARTARSAAAVTARTSAARPAESQAEPTVTVPEASAPTDVAAVAAPATEPVVENGAPAVLYEAIADAVPVALTATPAVAVATAAPTGLVAAAQGAVNGFFEALADGLASLPEGEFATTLEGALLLVRRTLFNQAPIATPVQTSVASTGEILGSLAGRDPEGDTVTYSVLTGPQFGTVELAEDGSYSYTPGDGYTGSDSFTVRMDGDASGFNIFSPGGHAATDVQVLVGAGAPTDPFAGTAAHQDPLDAALHLENASAQITVTKTNGRLTAAVSLTDINPETQLMWLDATGRKGQVSVAEMVSTHWEEYASAAEAGGGVTLGVVYEAENGTQHAVVLTDAHASQDVDGQITFTGDLAPDAESKTGYADDFWDVVGVGFKSDYENFRREYVEFPGFTTTSFAVTGADVYTDTYSLSEYKAELAAADGIRYPDLSGNPNSSASTATGQWPSGTLAQPDGRILQLNGAVTATLPDAKGAIVGLTDGSVRQWDGTGWKQLRAPGAGAVKALLALPGGMAAVLQQDKSVGVYQFDGTAWKYLPGTGLNWASDQIDLQMSALKAIQTPSGYILSVVLESECWTTCDSDKANPYTYVQLYQGGTSTSAPSVKGTRLVGAIAYNNGVVASFDDGTVQRFDGTAWSTLLDNSASWGLDNETLTTAVAPYKDGIVITQDDGSVRSWTPSTGWVDNIGDYAEIDADRRLIDGAVTALTVVDDKVFVGYNDGELRQFNPDAAGYANAVGPGTVTYPISDEKTAQSLGLPIRNDGYGAGAVTSVLAYGPGVAVTWADGVVGQYDFSTKSWSSMRQLADGEAVSSIVKDGNNLVIAVNTDGSLGHVSEWTPASGQFLEVGAANDLALNPETLKSAIAYVQGGGQATSAGDPLFSRAENRAACESAGTCTGTYQLFEFFTDPALPYGVPLKTYMFGARAATDAVPPSLNLRYDLGITSYGYLFIPDSKWQQVDPTYYSLGFMLAKTTGPSINLNLPLSDEVDGRFALDVASTPLDELSYEVPTPFGVFGTKVGLNVGLRASLELAAGFGDLPWAKQKLTVSYYDTQGTVYTYNTAGREGFAKTDAKLPPEFTYPGGDVIKNLTLGPTLSPTVDVSWGLFKTFPIIGELSFLKLSLGYENPVTLNFGVDDKGSPKVTGSVAGNFAAEASVFGSFVNFLTWKYSKAIYKDTVDLVVL